MYCEFRQFLIYIRLYYIRKLKILILLLFVCDCELTQKEKERENSFLDRANIISNRTAITDERTEYVIGIR